MSSCENSVGYATPQARALNECCIPETTLICLRSRSLGLNRRSLGRQTRPLKLQRGENISLRLLQIDDAPRAVRPPCLECVRAQPRRLLNARRRFFSNA